MEQAAIVAAIVEVARLKADDIRREETLAMEREAASMEAVEREAKEETESCFTGFVMP